MDNRPFEALITRLSTLDKLHKLYQQAETELENHIGVPICMDHCGKCCQTNTPMVWGIEVDGLLSYLLGQGRLLDDVLDRCESWLLDNKRPIKSPDYLLNDRERFIIEAQETITSQCPMLNKDMRCIIHEMRPLPCRAFGVTSYPLRCTRPCGRGETSNKKAYNKGMADIIKKETNALLTLSKEDDFSVTVGFLPTLLMSRVRSDRFVNLVDSGKISPVKLVRNYIHSPAILTEDQKIDFSLAGAEVLDEVEKNGIKVGTVIPL